MKKIFSVIALFLGFALNSANSQITDLVIQGTYNKGFPGTLHNGTDIPIRIFMPPTVTAARANPNNKEKYAVGLFHPGCGEKTSEQSDRTNLNTSELWKLTRTEPFNLLQNSSGSLWNRTYRYPNGQFKPIIWVGAQLWGAVGAVNCGGGTGGYTFTYNYLTYYTLKYLKEFYSDIIDTNKIFICGLSQGGGACNIAIQDSIINSQLCAAILCCPGYDNYTGFDPTGRTNTSDAFNWDDLAASGLPTWYFHSNNDNTTADCGGGSGCSRTVVNQINSRNPLVVPKFTEFVSTSHNLPWNVAFNPVNWNNIYTLSNGETFTLANLDPITWALQFTKNTRVSRRPDRK